MKGTRPGRGGGARPAEEESSWSGEEDEQEEEETNGRGGGRTSRVGLRGGLGRKHRDPVDWAAYCLAGYNERSSSDTS